ncbi:MAG: hydrogenase nickel incorporation protein HypA [bacterium]|nr:hydrogenase nickel incorporation protein HypA [bacterium]
MHEWALAEGVLTSALKACDREGLSEITKIIVSIGELQQIEIDIFEHALKEVQPANEPRLASTDIQLRVEPAQFKCRICKREFTFPEAAKNLVEEESEAIHFVPELAHTYFRCPDCGSPDFEVVQGRGVWIRSIEGRT